MNGVASPLHRRLDDADDAGGWKLRRSAPTPIRNPRGRMATFFWWSLDDDASDAAVGPTDVDGCCPISNEGVSESHTLLSGHVRPHWTRNCV